MATRTERARAFASSEGGKTAAQLFAYVVGLVLVAVGVIGFAYDSSFDTGQGINGDKVLGILEVNGIHNLVHIGSGLLLLLTAPKRVSARLGVIGFGTVYALVTLIGLLDGEDVITLLPVNPADNVLHLALATLALLAGFTSPADDARHAGGGGSRARA